MKIKGFSTAKTKYYGKKERIKKIYKSEINKSIIEKGEMQEVQNIEKAQEETKNQNCFALVIVRKLPWYKKLAKNIRNFFVVYRWRKAR